MNKGSPTTLNEQLNDMKLDLERTKARIKYKESIHNNMKFSNYWPRRDKKQLIVDEDMMINIKKSVEKFKK